MRPAKLSTRLYRPRLLCSSWREPRRCHSVGFLGRQCKFWDYRAWTQRNLLHSMSWRIQNWDPVVEYPAPLNRLELLILIFVCLGIKEYSSWPTIPQLYINVGLLPRLQLGMGILLTAFVEGIHWRMWHSRGDASKRRSCRVTWQGGCTGSSRRGRGCVWISSIDIVMNCNQLVLVFKSGKRAKSYATKVQRWFQS